MKAILQGQVPTPEKIGSYSKSEVNTLLNSKANNATTLDGYGIEDAYTKSKVDAIADTKLNVYGKGVNLLDNWYFANPVNQRGQTEYTGAGYTIDRWALNEGAIQISNDGILLKNGSYWRQPIENYNSLAGKIATLSVLTGDALYSGTSVLPTTSFTNFFFDSVYGYMAVEPMGNPLYINANGADVKIRAVKLELGDTQTLAHQDENGNWALNDPPPNYQQELAKCQRYQLIIPVGGTRFASAVNYISGDSFIPTPVTLRSNPTVTKYGTNNPADYGSVYCYPDSIRVTNISTTGMVRPNGVGINLTGFSDASHSGSGAWGEVGLLLDANL